MNMQQLGQAAKGCAANWTCSNQAYGKKAKLIKKSGGLKHSKRSAT
jgi:hypothetical protein